MSTNSMAEDTALRTEIAKEEEAVVRKLKFRDVLDQEIKMCRIKIEALKKVLGE